MNLTFTELFLSTTFIIGLGTFIFLSVGAFIGYATAKIEFDQASLFRYGLPWALFLLFSVWFAAAMATSTAGLISPELVLLFSLFPIVFGLILSFVPPINTLLREIPTHWLIGLQAYRAGGFIFIIPFMTAGALTPGFAWPAGIGDVLTGLLAIPAAWAVYRYGANARWGFLAWTTFGIGDLILAFVTANIFGFNMEGVAPNFPITLIPLFIGPPFGILIHLITVRNFNLRHAAPEMQPETAFR